MPQRKMVKPLMRLELSVLLVGLLTAGCAHLGKPPPPKEVRFDPLLITGDLELEKLNAEELFAAGSSFFAAKDFKQAARYFGRLADFFPDSPHLRPSLYNAGLSHQKLREWDLAYQRFAELADAQKGKGDALDATFRLAECLYHLERFDEASELLTLISNREDLAINHRVEAMVQKGICELEGGKSEQAESTLRKALGTYHALEDKDQVEDYYPAQAQFFLGEIYRLHFLSVQLDPDKGIDQLAKDLEYKAELLLSAQGHYLRSIRTGNGYWATASGSQIGGLYENLYEHMVHSPAPKELNAEEAEVYRQELRKKIRVLITKAITIYERTLEAAERIGAANPFVDKTRESLRKMKDLLLADAQDDDDVHGPTPDPGAEDLDDGSAPAPKT